MERATELKEAGNVLFKKGDWTAAADMYGQAIVALTSAQLTDTPAQELLSVLHSNRAACHINVHDTASALADCDAALRANPRNVKALYRRAAVYEGMGDDGPATAATASTPAAAAAATAASSAASAMTAPRLSRKQCLESALQDIRALIRIEPQHQDAGRMAQRLATALMATRHSEQSYTLALDRVRVDLRK